jgi:CBS domain-containing protein
MRVRDLLGRKQSTMITVDSSAPVQDAIRLMIDHNVGGLPVVTSDGAVIGFVAERDLIQAMHEHQVTVHTLPVERVMRSIPACDADEPIEEAMRRMTSQRQRHLVVNDTGTFIGVISVGDIVKYRLEQLEMETGVLRDYVAAQRASRG